MATLPKQILHQKALFCAKAFKTYPLEKAESTDAKRFFSIATSATWEEMRDTHISVCCNSVLCIFSG